MHVNSGYFDDGYEVIKNHVEAFDSWDWDVAVAPSGSCVASLRHQQAMVARSRGDEALALKAEQIASRTFELSQLLIDILGITNAAEQLGSYFPEHVTYHSSCHGMRMLYGHPPAGPAPYRRRHQVHPARGHGPVLWLRWYLLLQER